MTSLPIMLNVKDKTVAVIGAGSVAIRHIPKLIHAGMKEINVYAPYLQEDLIKHIENGSISWINKTVTEEDQFTEDLILLATNNSSLHLAILKNKLSRQLIYMADSVEKSDIHFPMTVEKGLMVLALSTSGASPTYSKRLMKELDQFLGDSIEDDLDFLEKARKQIKTSGINQSSRRQILVQIASREFLDLPDREKQVQQLITMHQEKST
ncbi:precorrin-2 dehydrogenase/sirohydrochlorin ferrochelatase family protein [Halalkalibacter akibai]|uniref:precorrin-2 dehydrogenase n=1 Tax=Halalkalibacter akibai (strain ATCC 43226 / DSM 21942 / CIP 109018 / JCM 9157 / 1139) TaxID=1236973 RepID=W4QQB6_HALA3|nr:bifunctional precorrin-2 dehydrogenase/sirohydrochlorin ferrochelatase [Halalkalibacter akibai]GAE33519.1 siroheme synthase [Halalkalibacter akibai JCM 9157]